MKVQIPPEVAYEVLGDEAVVLNLATGRYYRLNQLATELFEAVRDHGDLDTVEAGLVRKYEVDAAVLAADVGRLVDQLSSYGLLQPVDTETGRM